MRAKFILYIFLPLFFLISCQKEEIIDEPKRRTVLFYLAGDNNLSHYMRNNVEMIKAGIKKEGIKNGNIIIYEAFRGQKPHLYQLKLEQEQIQQIEIASYEADQSSASAETLDLILNKVQHDFPAKSYGLVLSSHGTGWLPANLDQYLRSFGYDGKGNHIDINDLSSTLSKYHFDFILFDACYMACTEVVYALRNCTDYIIGSPNEILIDGFPYSEIIGDFFENKVDVIDIATKFYSYYQNSSGSVSVVKTSELDGLATICQDIFKEKTENDLFAIPVHELQPMELLKRNQHALYDFEDYISHVATPEQYNTFRQELGKVVIYKASTPTLYFEKQGTIAIDKFSGLSIYVPQPELGNLNEWYKTLDWYQDIYK